MVRVEECNGVKSLVSLRVDPTMTDYFKTYARNGIIKTVNRGLAFQTLRQAEDWLGYIGRYEIWECQGRQISLPKRFVNLWHWADGKTWRSIRSFLLYGQKRTISLIYDRILNDSFPIGTVQLRDLKLVKLVRTYDRW